MKKEITDEQLIELIEGVPNAEVEKALGEDPELQKRFDQMKELMTTIDQSSEMDVPMHIQMNISEAVLKEQAGQQQRFSWMQIAAAVTILLVGFGLGKFSGGASQSELADLRQEILSLKEVTLTSALQQYSASERIMAVNRIEESQINPELVTTLVSTLNTDESPNVRYAALQALANYIDHKDVRAELVKSLEAQKDPLIQISLISILVEAEERSAIAPLKELLEDDQAAPEVKQQAEVAIQVLT